MLAVDASSMISPKLITMYIGMTARFQPFWLQIFSASCFQTGQGPCLANLYRWSLVTISLHDCRVNVSANVVGHKCGAVSWSNATYQ